MTTVNPTINSTKMFCAILKLEIYVNRYATRASLLSDALTTRGCQAVNKIFELTDKSIESPDDMSIVAKIIKQIIKLDNHINKNMARATDVSLSLKTRGTSYLTTIIQEARSLSQVPIKA